MHCYVLSLFFLLFLSMKYMTTAHVTKKTIMIVKKIASAAIVMQIDFDYP